MKYISSIAFASLLFFTGCSENKTETKEVVQSAPKVQKEKMVQDETIDKVAQDIKEKTSTVVDTAAQMAKELSEESKDIVDEVKVESDKVIKKIAKETKEMTTVAVQTINEVKENIDVKMDEVIKQEGTLTQEQLEEAQNLFLKCAGCHGNKAERSALSQSKIIQDFSVEQIIDALKGYKAGTYGGTMKGVMQGQVAGLTDEQIELLAQYITTLK
jgi:cytochrome c553